SGGLTRAGGPVRSRLGRRAAHGKRSTHPSISLLQNRSPAGGPIQATRSGPGGTREVLGIVVPILATPQACSSVGASVRRRAPPAGPVFQPLFQNRAAANGSSLRSMW